MLQRAAVCCSVLQRACTNLQIAHCGTCSECVVIVSCSVLQYTAVCCSMLQCVVVCCSVHVRIYGTPVALQSTQRARRDCILLYTAVCCRMLQRVAVSCAAIYSAGGVCCIARHGR